MTSANSPAASAVAPQRYHPAQVALHWLIALLVFLTPLLAGEGEGRGAPASVGGIPLIDIHMILGLSVLALLVVRLVVRLAVRRPRWASTGSSLLDFVGRWTHVGLYFFTFAVTVTGLVFALQTNRLAGAFAGNAAGPSAPRLQQPGQLPPAALQPPAERPEGFRGGLRLAGSFLFRAFHELSWIILLALILLHVAAALYHQFILKDHLLRAPVTRTRMPRSSQAS